MTDEPRTYTTRGGEVREVPPVMPKSRNRDPSVGGMNTTARITARNKADLAKGVHPATRIALLHQFAPDDHPERCGNCVHHQSWEWYGSRKKIYHKCDQHRLGQSHCAASDIRTGWPACTLWAPEQKAE